MHNLIYLIINSSYNQALIFEYIINNTYAIKRHFKRSIIKIKDMSNACVAERNSSHRRCIGKQVGKNISNDVNGQKQYIKLL